MAFNLIKQFLNENGDEHWLSGSLVIDELTGKNFSQVTAQANAADEALEELKAILNTFLTGEDDGGNIDRLTELVRAIGENKDSIDALTRDKLAREAIVNALDSSDETKVLSAAQGKVLKDLIDAVNARVAESGAIGYVASADVTPFFNGKLVMVVAPYEPSQEAD